MLTTFLAFILAWYNLPFTILLGLCVILAVLQLVGLGGDHEGDHTIDHDADVDADMDADADVDADMDADADADAAGDLDHAVEHDLEHGGGDMGHAAPGGASLMNVLAFVGVGKAPLLVVLLILFSSIGLIGWVLNGLAQGLVGAWMGWAFIVVWPAALGFGILTSARAALFIGRMLPPLNTTARPAQAYVGRVGTVISPMVDEKYGQVHLRNTDQSLMSVFAVAAPGETYKRGDKVALVAYDAQRKIYTVTRAPEL